MKEILTKNVWIVKNTELDFENQANIDYLIQKFG